MRLRVSIIGCTVLLFLTGWGHWGPQVKIGVSLDHAQGRGPLISRLREAMGDNRADLLLRDAEDVPTDQEKQMKEMIQEGIQALVLLPFDPSKAAPLVQIAHQAGIKVISLERLIPDSGLDYLVAFDARKAGELQARAMARKVPKGRYVLLTEDPGDEFSKDFSEGQMKALRPLIDRGDIQIAASLRIRPFHAAKQLDDVLAREAKGADAVLTSSGRLAGEVVTALKKLGPEGNPAVAGTGEDLATCRRIHDGTQLVTVYDPPRKLAEEAAYLAAKLARKATEFDCQFTEMDNGGEKVRAVLLTPEAVDAKNLDSTVIQDRVQRKEDIDAETRKN